MAVLKKRRTTHGKSARQQQLQQQQQLRAKQRFENSRLKPEQMSSIVHDESDTLSYRSYLTMNFVRSAEFMDVLMTQPIPNNKIRPPRIYGNVSLEDLKDGLAAQKVELQKVQESLANYTWALNEKSEFLKNAVRASETQEEEYPGILKQYLEKFNLRSQDDRVMFHKDKFLALKSDTREAPPDYWQKHEQLKKEQRDKALMLERQKKLEEEENKRKQLAEEAKQKLELEENLRRKELEEAEQQQMQLQMQLEQQFGQSKVKEPVQTELQQQQQQQQQSPSFIQAQAKSHIGDQLDETRQNSESQSETPQQLLQQDQSQEPQQQNPIPNQDGMDGIFEDFGNEPFNNGFDDEFGDLDAAFF